MIHLKRMNNAALKVRNLEESLAWYAKHFGFEYIHSVEGCIVIGKNSIELVLSPHNNPGAPLADPNTMRCIHTLGFEVLEEEFPMARERFIKEDPELVDIDQEEFRSIIVSDPDGYCIELYYNKLNKAKKAL